MKNFEQAHKDLQEFIFDDPCLEDYERDEEGNILCPYCGEIIDPDRMICPECKEYC